MNISDAIGEMRCSRKVCREGWNGKDMWLMMAYRNGWAIDVGDGHKLDYERPPFIFMKTAQNTLVPWVASQSDLLAEDWRVVK